MSRIILREEQGPLPIPKSQLPAGDSIYVCQCGLSKNGVFCDGSHTATRTERAGELYVYGETDGRRYRSLVQIAVSEAEELSRPLAAPSA